MWGRWTFLRKLMCRHGSECRDNILGLLESQQGKEQGGRLRCGVVREAVTQQRVGDPVVHDR
ncbi:hypothetical protein DXZ75_19490 [Streptomyces sp. AcE210]|nr:hypothetical protein DXZ75_19490 [Streptomyces sp. AcE210]